MPKERFFNLPEEKKQRIMQAAIGEFSRAPYEKVSINRIIRDAEIPRGSFYQYFEDKADLRSYLLKGFQVCLKEKVQMYLDEKQGDLFQFFKDVLDVIIKESFSEEMRDVSKNLFCQMRYGGHCLKDIVTDFRDGTRLMEGVVSQMRQLYYPEYTLDELMTVTEMLIQFIKESIANIFLYEEHIEEIKENYYKKLALIETGMKAQKKESKHV